MGLHFCVEPPIESGLLSRSTSLKEDKNSTPHAKCSFYLFVLFSLFFIFELFLEKIPYVIFFGWKLPLDVGYYHNGFFPTNTDDNVGIGQYFSFHWSGGKKKMTIPTPEK